MAVSQDGTVRDGGDAPDKPAEGPEESTRRLVAVVVSITFSIGVLLVLIGGLAGRFNQTLVEAAVTALIAAAGAVWAYLFHRKRPGDE